MATLPISSELRIPAHIGYSCLNDVLTEVKSVRTFDLLRYTPAVLMSMGTQLGDAPPGAYLVGSLEPIVTFYPETPFYSATQWQHDPTHPDITDYARFIQCRDPILRQDGSLVCNPPAQMPKYYQDHCTHPYSAVYLLANAALHHLSYENPLNRMPSTNLKDDELTVSRFVPNLLDVYSGGAGFDRAALLEVVCWHARPFMTDIDTFVAGDRWHLYHVRLQNTTLIIEKGNDFRVVEYYRYVFDKLEEAHIQQYGF